MKHAFAGKVVAFGDSQTRRYRWSSGTSSLKLTPSLFQNRRRNLTCENTLRYRNRCNEFYSSSVKLGLQAWTWA